MYEEGNKRLSLNWGSLLIKLVILAAIVFIAGWIFIRITGNKTTKNNTLANGNSEYITNINAMKTAAFEYFTASKLPEKVGGTEKLTLAQMINQKSLIDFTNDGKTCDTNSSYVQATKTADGNYALKVSLTCGDKSDFIVTTIEKAEVNNSTNTNTNTNTNSQTNTNSSTNTNTSTNSSTTTTKKPSSTTTNKTSNKTTTKTVTTKTTVTIKLNGTITTDKNNNNNNDTPITTGKTTYYKLVKYSPWKSGYEYGSNVENKQEKVGIADYCKKTTKTYYTTGYITEAAVNNSSWNYELQLTDIDPDEVAYIKLDSRSYFSSSSLTDYRAYMNRRDKDLYMTGNNGYYNVYFNSASDFRTSSLKSSNFTFGVGQINYSNSLDAYRTTVTINFRNKNGVTPYYDSKVGYVYFIPLKFNVQVAYKDDCVTDTTDNWSDHVNTTVINQRSKTMWVHRTYEYTWSKDKNLSGWEYTGISKEVE